MNSITMRLPYQDYRAMDFTTCSAEVMLKGWKDCVRKVLDCFGTDRMVLSVSLEDDQIVIKLSEGVFKIPDSMNDTQRDII